VHPDAKGVAGQFEDVDRVLLTLLGDLQAPVLVAPGPERIALPLPEVVHDRVLDRVLQVLGFVRIRDRVGVARVVGPRVRQAEAVAEVMQTLIEARLIEEAATEYALEVLVSSGLLEAGLVEQAADVVAQAEAVADQAFLKAEATDSDDGLDRATESA